MSVHQSGPFVEWLLATLRVAGLTVGDAQKPDDVPAGAGYAVVYVLPGGETSGSIDAPRSDATVSVQVTSSSENPTHTRALADLVRSTLNDAVPATLPDGRGVVWLDFPEGSPSVNRDDQVQEPRYFSPDRFEFGTA